MSVKLILGAQWGDEGKGKLVDVLAEKADLVARYQGGANAGHTVHVGDKKFVLHLIPGGILRENITCIIGGGVVFDPEAFFEEVETLNNNGIKINQRLFVSDRAHIIFPYHKILDRIKEANLDSRKIGTTCRGIGPAYVDKYNRCGIRLIDLFDDQILNERLSENIEQKNRILVDYYNEPPLSFKQIYDQTQEYAEKLKPFCTDTSLLIYESWKNGNSILLEGAQGCLLDIDFGSYPYVTSSNPTCGGAVTGTGLPANAINEIIGVIKAYTTRVGSGPFPSEEEGTISELLRKEGNEFGATTGRPRRCGWFDAVAAKYAIRVNGMTNLALTKMDVLDNFKQINVCTKYKHNGKIIENFPANVRALESCEPVFEKLEGWNESIANCTRFNQLPKKAQEYVNYIESLCSISIKYISVGVDRKQIITRY